MDPKLAQLADILVDWCGADLEGIIQDRPEPTQLAQEAIRCLVFTMAATRDARDLFVDLLGDELARIRELHKD